MRRPWHAEKAYGGEWVAARVVDEADGPSTTAKVRVRRALGVPPSWSRNEVEAHIRALVRRGALEP